MSQWPKLQEIDASVQIDELLGPLGYADGDAVQPSVMDEILAETGRSQQAMRGNTIYSCLPARRAGRSSVEIDGITIEDETLAGSVDGAPMVAVAVCTVGPEIERIIAEHFDRGDYLQGMIADVTGSRAVENVAHKCAASICAEARELNLSTANRLSPGYGKWNVSGQRAVFAVLDPTPIGVSLNDHCMMQPNKSISFVIPLVDGESHHDDRPPCVGCDFKNCSYRRK
jgi:hypothetical protein